MGKSFNINPWIEMWIKPRETIRSIINFNPNYMLLPILSIIYGFPLVVQLMQSNYFSRFSTSVLVVLTLLASLVVGFILLNLVAVGLHWTGKWIGGSGTFQQIRAAVAWASIPNLFAIVIWLISLFGRSYQQDPYSYYYQATSFNQSFNFDFFLGILQLVIFIWALIMQLNALGEVQRFSIWKALLNILILFAICFFAISVLAWLGRMAN